jgi:hypothetical protein
MNSIMAPILVPRETADLQGRTARGSMILALWGQPCARLLIRRAAKYCPNGAWPSPIGCDGGEDRTPSAPSGSPQTAWLS